ncbi:hypothetical protein K438DRAFT_1996645 [Mycena galopus ATCC 62051]|nr:hypothetical protein K438DRAFT_1996645 [Mycena galopus ATCC 62051]
MHAIPMVADLASAPVTSKTNWRRPGVISPAERWFLDLKSSDDGEGRQGVVLARLPARRAGYADRNVKDVLVDFAARTKNRSVEAEAGKDNAGLYEFHRALPTQQRATVGEMPRDWDTMIDALENMPQLTVQAAVADY